MEIVGLKPDVIQEVKYMTPDELKLMEDNKICEICYSNCKSTTHKCDECHHTICISCVATASTCDIDKNKYTLKCPYCRTDKIYNFDGLLSEEWMEFYKSLNNKARKHLIADKYFETDYFYYKESTLTAINFLKDFRQTLTNKSPTPARIEQNILLGHTLDELHSIGRYREALVEKKEDYLLRKNGERIAELEHFEKLYLSSAKYNASLKNITDSQKNQLEIQKNQLDIQKKQLDMLSDIKKQNEELLSKMTDIKNTLNDTALSKKPAQKIKLIADKVRRTDTPTFKLYMELTHY